MSSSTVRNLIATTRLIKILLLPFFPAYGYWYKRQYDRWMAEYWAELQEMRMIDNLERNLGQGAIPAPKIEYPSNEQQRGSPNSENDTSGGRK